MSIEKKTAQIQGSKHVPELLSVLGLAALLVVVHHCTFYYAYRYTVRSWSEYLLNAHAAVVRHARPLRAKRLQRDDDAPEPSGTGASVPHALAV